MRVLLIVYDNDSYIHYFPMGLAYIASALRNAGHSVTIYNQDFHHYPCQHLTGYLNENRFDVAGIGVIGGYYQYRKLLEISEAVNAAQNRPYYIIGGHGPSPDPKYFLTKTGADAAVIGEGEITIVELLDAVAGNRGLYSVKGIAFCDKGHIVINERRELIEDVDNIAWPAYDLFPMEYYRLLRDPHTTNRDFVLPMLSGRGCKFECNFCYRMDKGFRPRRNQTIIDEIQFLKRNYDINYIDFSDELLMSSEERTIGLCRDFIDARLNIKWFCNGRLNYARREVLDWMKRAGCVFINYGIESMDDLALKNMNKALTTKMIIRGIEATLEAGISPGYNIIFGNIGENLEVLHKDVEFLLKYDDCAQMRTIRPVTPYPGSPLYYYAIEKGLLHDCEDFYENKHVNSDLLSVNFTELPDDTFHQALYEANSVLIDNYFEKKKQQVKQQAANLYLAKNTEFRGFRQT